MRDIAQSLNREEIDYLKNPVTARLVGSHISKLGLEKGSDREGRFIKQTDENDKRLRFLCRKYGIEYDSSWRE